MRGLQFDEKSCSSKAMSETSVAGVEWVFYDDVCRSIHKRKNVILRESVGLLVPAGGLSYGCFE